MTDDLTRTLESISCINQNSLRLKVKAGTKYTMYYVHEMIDRDEVKPREAEHGRVRPVRSERAVGELRASWLDYLYIVQHKI